MQLFNPVTRKNVEAINLEDWDSTRGYGIAEVGGIQVKYAWVEDDSDDSLQWTINATDAAKLPLILGRELVAAPVSITPREKQFEVCIFNRIAMTRVALTASEQFASLIYGEYRHDGEPVALYDNGELKAAANTTNPVEPDK